MIPIEFYIALPYLEAFALAVAIPVVITLQYRLGTAVRADVRLMVLLTVVAFGALLTVTLAPRNLDERMLVPRAQMLLTDFDDSFFASRYLNFFVVSFSLAEWLRGWLAARSNAQSDPARPILYTLVAFYFGTIAIQALGSAHPSFSYKALYVPIVLFAVYYQRVDDIGPALIAAKAAIFALTAGSLLAMVFKPDFVLHRPEPGVLPMVDFRLFGLTTHANALGPMALIALMLELHSPSQWRSLYLLQMVSAAVVLVLAQSKTAWMAGLAALMLVGLPVGLMPSRKPSQRASHFQRSVTTAWVSIVVAIALTVILFGSDIVGHVEQAADVDTLTGRTQIWEITLDGWRENLFFGYGRDIWGIERMLKFNMRHVGQAHNQFVQTLGDSGLVGLLALLAFLAALLHAGLSAFRSSRGLTLSLLIVIVARCVTEAPLQAEGVLSWPTFTLILMVLFSCHFVRTDANGLIDHRFRLRSTTFRAASHAAEPT